MELKIENMMYSKSKLIAAILFIVFISVSYKWFFSNETKKIYTQITPAPEVFTMQVVYSPLSVVTYGTIFPDKVIQIRSENPGVVDTVHYEESMHVKKGQLLFRLQDKTERSRLNSIRAQLAAKKSLLEKQQVLYKMNYISQQDALNILSEVKVLEAQEDETKVNLEKKAITAPFAGFISGKKINIGDYIDAGQSIVTLIGDDAYKAEYTLPDKWVPYIQVGDKVVINQPELNQTSIQGEVVSIDPQINQHSRSVSIRAKIDNISSTLKPGCFVKIKQIFDAKHSIIEIPQEAIRSSANINYVYRIIAGKAIYTPVITASLNGRLVGIKDGIKAGDIIVISGSNQITNGQFVKAIDKLGTYQHDR